MRRFPPVILEAIGGGTWAVIQHEIASRRAATELPQRAPEIVEFVVAPFDEPSRAGPLNPDG